MILTELSVLQRKHTTDGTDWSSTCLACLVSLSFLAWTDFMGLLLYIIPSRATSDLSLAKPCISLPQLVITVTTGIRLSFQASELPLLRYWPLYNDHSVPAVLLNHQLICR